MWPLIRQRFLPTALACLSLILMVALAYLTPISIRFGTNDDAGMANIVGGLVNGAHIGEPRLIFISAFFGELLAALQRAAPATDWYTLLQFTLCVGGFLYLSRIWLGRHNRLYVLLVYGGFVIAYMMPLFVHMQFTKTAYMMVLAGALAIIQSGFTNRPLLAVALVCFSLGFMIRDASIGFSYIVVVSLIGYRFLFRTESTPVRTVMVAGAIMLAALTASHQLHKWGETRLFYDAPEWRGYHETNLLRARIQHNFPDKNALDTVLERLRVEDPLAASEYELILGWMMLSKSYYNADFFREIEKRYEEFQPRPLRRLNDALAKTVAFFLHAPGFRHYLIIGFALALVVNMSYRSLFTTLYWTSVMVTTVFVISYLFRSPPYRIWLPTMMVITAITITLNLVHSQYVDSSHSAGENFRFRQYLDTPGWRIALLLMVLAFGLRDALLWHVVDFGKRFSRLCTATDRRLNVMNQLGEDARFYVVGAVLYSGCYTRPMNNQVPAVITDRSVIFGWMNLTPWMQSYAFHDGDSSLVNDICENDNAYVIAGNKDALRIERYLRELPSPYRLELTGPADPEADDYDPVYWHCGADVGAAAVGPEQLRDSRLRRIPYGARRN